MRIAIDMASILKTCLAAGKDAEGYTVEHEGKSVQINTAAYGYEFVVNSIKAALDEFGLMPMDLIMVTEGMHSKAPRLDMDSRYKATRGSRPAEYYNEYQSLQDQVRKAFLDLGALEMVCDNVEGDDQLAFLAKHTEEDMVIMSNDGDLVALHGVNAHGANVRVRINGEIGYNKFGPFPHHLVTTYKALVGDPSDNIKGCPGFGPKKFLDFIAKYKTTGLVELHEMLENGKLRDLEALAEEWQCPLLGMLFEQRIEVQKSYNLARLYPEWVDNLTNPVRWSVGLVRSTDDERLKPWSMAQRLVTADNFDKAKSFFQQQLLTSQFVALDLETTVPDESDDWLAASGKDGIDVIGSKITGCGLTFGPNSRYSFYVCTNHADTNNCSMEQLRTLLECIPQTLHIVCHNSAGFELPVLYNAFGKHWQANGWRGFLPNTIDTRIMASFYDESGKQGLKDLSKRLMNYDQVSYDTVTGGRKMHQLSGDEVFSYGTDDTAVTAGLFNFFRLFMQLEHSWDTFMDTETLPPYLTAQAFTKGVRIDLPKLKQLSRDDEAVYDQCWETLSSYLVEHGWEGVHPPVFTEISPANIKQAVQVVLGTELKTLIRTISKLAILVREIDGGDLLARFIEDNDLDSINKLVAQHWTSKPIFNVGSPLQISKLMYNVMNLPVRLRNPATETQRAAGQREGNPRTDDDAVGLTLKLDATPQTAPVLNALLTMKSCNTRKALYWDAWPSMIHWDTGRLHPSFRQSATNTRRYTCSKPNLQQMEAGPVRACLLPEPGHVIASLDFAGQEVRALCALSGDENLRSVFVGESLKDIHSITASTLLGVPYEQFYAEYTSTDPAVQKIAKGVRDKAKICFFASAYGAMSNKIAETLAISEDEAQKILDAIDQAFPRTVEHATQVERLVKEQGYITLHPGTRRHLRDEIQSPDKWIAAKAVRQAGNAEIQGSCAAQIKRVLSRIWSSDVLDQGAVFIASIHDEVVLSVPKDRPDLVKAVHGFMIEEFWPGLPAVSSVGVGPNYLQLNELGESATLEQISTAMEAI